MDKGAQHVQIAPGPTNYTAHSTGDLHVAKAHVQSSLFILLDLSTVPYKVNHPLLHDTFLFSLISIPPYSPGFPSTLQSISPWFLLLVSHFPNFKSWEYFL